MNRIPGELDGDGRVRLLGATLPVKGERPVGQDKVDALVRPESLRMTAVPDGNGIVTIATFLGSLTRVSVLLPGDVTVQVDQPSAEAAVMLPGTSVQVSVAQAPVLVATRR
jgi:putative spermidine/putrescine transport system ATP-binding protein